MFNREKNDMTTETPLPYDSSKFKAPSFSGKQRASRIGKPVLLTIVNTPKCGKRVAVAPKVLEQLGSPTTVQVAISEDGVALGEHLPENDARFTLKTLANKSVIYSAPLVDSLTDSFELDFSGRSSISFGECSLMETEDGEPVVLFPIKAQQPASLPLPVQSEDIFDEGELS
ncbi:hypothetical protein SAMN04487895_11473 [Paenibacillus sophorae]|uniref:Uncharacterized protein n=1 Tax=Paenibacillus sophorae TaxID=1333845 RepID=A0A1H8TIY0_9BACL|nr:hypothetical protein [Paenibacillus sophorae]QWU16231.1 hypothetical protein KP014_02870 [Paenibacillus sophorae]SEO90746.1 hypothetical protein SAMN04487895_11473 [Paenibacillus sophorae]